MPFPGTRHGLRVGKRLQARRAPDPRASDGHLLDERVDLGQRPVGGDEFLVVGELRRIAKMNALDLCAMLRPQARAPRGGGERPAVFDAERRPASIEARTSRRSRSDLPKAKIAQACSSRAKSSAVKSA